VTGGAAAFPPGGREVYFEHIAYGGAAKCTAIDAVTGVEATVTGPAGAMRMDMERLALRALERRLAAQRGAG
jgi:hypothetical protein